MLVAYNVNLNTTSVRRANSIAFDVREAGRVVREGDPLTGPIKKDENGMYLPHLKTPSALHYNTSSSLFPPSGEPIRIPGSLQKVKAIGWYIEEYGIAQISINLTDISVTPVHVAFDEVCKVAFLFLSMFEVYPVICS